MISSTVYSNEARYFSSIPGNVEQKANCAATPLRVEGVPRIFIYTETDVEVGDILYIDYGDLFPTEDFIYIKNRKDLLNHENVHYQSELEEGELIESEEEKEEEEEVLSHVPNYRKRRFS